MGVLRECHGQANCTDIQRWFHGWSDRIAPFFTSQYHVEQVYYVLSVELASEGHCLNTKHVTAIQKFKYDTLLCSVLLGC